MEKQFGPKYNPDWESSRNDSESDQPWPLLNAMSRVFAILPAPIADSVGHSIGSLCLKILPDFYRSYSYPENSKPEPIQLELPL